ncbi:MAG: PDDEXK nuclease domain-containing protein [Bacteroidota bacterium]
MNFDHLTLIISSTHLSLHNSAANAVNKLLTIRNWLVGYYIVQYELKGEDRAKYGDKVIEKLSERLNEKDGFSFRNLKLYKQFYTAYPQFLLPVKEFIEGQESIGQSPIAQLESDETEPIEIRQSPIAQSGYNYLQISPDKLLIRLSYTHFVQLIAVYDPLKRTFYELECMKGNWSVRELKRQINSMYFERSGISKHPEKLSELIRVKIKPSQPKDIVKNVYAFEFLGLPVKNAVEESDLETALLDNLEGFILEMGNGFCFEARQKRILIGNEYYFIDMVFYHRILKCHVLLDLKIEDFNHVNAGQLNTYLNYYKQEIVEQNDNPPVGILLVTDKNNALVQYATAGMDENLFVQKYLLQLPSKEKLKKYIMNELKKF